MHLKASRELAEDATNFVELIEDSLSRAIAVGMDAVALNGFTDYSGGPAGLLNDGNVGETGSVGAIAWQDLATARTTIQANNYEPNAYMVHPTIGGDLDVLQTGDGSNSAANWLGAPPGVDTLARYTTTSVSTARLYMGQFNMLAVCVVRYASRSRTLPTTRSPSIRSL